MPNRVTRLAMAVSLFVCAAGLASAVPAEASAPASPGVGPSALAGGFAVDDAGVFVVAGETAAPGGETLPAISGTVTASGSGAPVAGVFIQALNTSGGYVAGTVTNASGGYVLSGLWGGTYYVRTANLLGYVDELFDNVACPGQICPPVATGTGVAVDPPNLTTGIDFALAMGGTITGTVTAAGTGTPLANVTVRVYTAAGTQVGYTLATNASGVYTSAGLPAGTYYVQTWNSLGYVDELYNNVPCPGGGCAVTTGTGVPVTAGGTASGIDFALAVGGAISGTVTDAATGTPIAGVRVYVSTASGGSTGYNATTDASGAYTKTGLPTGTYYVWTSNDLGYIDELYDNLLCLRGSCYPYTSGTGVGVTAGATASGVNFALAVGGWIAGTVTDAGMGAPLANVSVFVSASTNPNRGFGVSTDAAGTYAMTGLPAGTYYAWTSNSLGYIDELYNGLPCPGGRCPSATAGTGVAVEAPYLTPGIDFALDVGATITGTVRAAGTGTPLANATVRLYTAAGTQVGYTLTTNASGVYTSAGLPAGTYYVKTSNSLGYVDELYDNVPCPGGTCTVTTGTGVPVTAGATASGIDFALDVGATIAGTVTAAGTGAPLASASVTFYNASGSSVGSATTNTSGVYSRTGLAAGTYYVRADKSGYYPEVYDNLPAWTLVTSGTPVTVAPGGTAAANFALAVDTGPNTSATAVELPLGTTEGLVYTAGQAPDITWYKFFVPPEAAGQDLKVNVRIISPYPVPPPTNWRSDVDFDLLDSALALRANAHGGTDNETVYLHDIVSGWYYLNIPYFTTDYADMPIARYTVTVETGTAFGVGYISGRVVDGNGQGIEQVQVEVRQVPHDHNTSFPTLLTGAGGYFSFAVAPGLRDLYFTGDGTQMENQPEVNVVDEYYLDSPTAAGATHVTVSEAQTLALGDIHMGTGAIVTGRVTNQSGSPLFFATAYSYDTAGRSFSYARTDANGEFTLQRIPTGGAVIRFSAGSYALEYYDDRPSIGSGTVLATQPGIAINGVNAVLTPGGAISGTVKNADGAAVGVSVVLYSVLDGVFSRASTTSSTTTGTFSFTYVKPGDYKIFVNTAGKDYTPAWYGGASTFADATVVTVTEGGTTSGIAIVLGSPSAGDFTGDGTSDILWRNATGGDMWLWGISGAAHALDAYVGLVGDANWEVRGQGDQNADGRADLLWRNRATGEVYVWLMDGAAPAAELYVATVDLAYDIAGVGDFNGDHKSDILWRNALVGDMWLWFMDGAKSTSQVYVDTVDPSYAVKGVGDLSGDVKADIVWQGAAGDLWAWLMNGAAKTAQSYVGTVADSRYQIQQVADFDGLGKADLLWWNTVQGDVWIWSMDGAAVASESYVGVVPDTNYRIQAAGDYNGDGKADILWRNIVAGDLWVWLMNGPVKASEAYVGLVTDQGYQIVR